MNELPRNLKLTLKNRREAGPLVPLSRARTHASAPNRPLTRNMPAATHAPATNDKRGVFYFFTKTNIKHKRALSFCSPSLILHSQALNRQLPQHAGPDVGKSRRRSQSLEDTPDVRKVNTIVANEHTRGGTQAVSSQSFISVALVNRGECGERVRA